MYQFFSNKLLFLIIKSITRMAFLYNNSIINEIVDKLFKHRRAIYSEFHLDDIVEQLGIKHQIVQVINSYYEKIYASIFQKRSNIQICIVFLHGYGSNRLECLNILEFLPQKYALCCFDFSGCGKSQGDLITYGMKEKQDIHAILNFLKGEKGFKKFILWGRSMGATSALLYTIKYKPANIILLVLDSAFYSFESIAFDIANKNTKAPQFVISFALKMAKKNCIKFQQNPFQIQLKDVDKITIPNNVINAQNTYNICSRYKAKYEKFIITQNHNTIRSSATISKILFYIDKYQIKDRNVREQYNGQIKKVQIIIFTHDKAEQLQKRPDKQQSNSNQIKYLHKKGIQRVNQIIQRQRKVNINNFIDYVNTSNERFQSPILKKPHLSLQSIKNHFLKTQKAKIDHNNITFSIIDQQSFSNSSNKKINKKISLIQSTKSNRKNKQKILA